MTWVKTYGLAASSSKGRLDDTAIHDDDPAEEVCGLGDRPFVGPDGGRLAEEAAGGTQRDAPQAMARDRQTGDAPRIGRAGGQQLPGALHHAVPPRGRPLLVPAGLRILGFVGNEDRRQATALGIVERRLVATSSQVVGQDLIGHRCSRDERLPAAGIKPRRRRRVGRRTAGGS
jgi:hypothetical protein